MQIRDREVLTVKTNAGGEYVIGNQVEGGVGRTFWRVYVGSHVVKLWPIAVKARRIPKLAIVGPSGFRLPNVMLVDATGWFSIKF